MIPVYQNEIASQKLAELSKANFDLSDQSVEASVSKIIAQVKADGDSALKALAKEFGDAVPDSFLLPQATIDAAIKGLPQETKTILDTAAKNIRTFAEAVKKSVQSVSLDHGEFSVGLDWRPVDKVACYVPGGRYALPSTALMTAITSQVAGVPEITIVSPRFGDEVIYAGSLAGATRYVQLGGAQAVAALAFGTETILSVDMIVGPGNAYVTEAKRQLQGVLGIDMLAGPSEVAIIADSGANPTWVAIDLLAQAEHDPDARAYLFTDSLKLAEAVAAEIPVQVQNLGLPEFMQQSLTQSGLFVLKDLAACVDAANALAPEHLALMVANPDQLKTNLRHYGAVFLGYGTTVPHGDYLAGPNHTLPTARSARFNGSLNPLTFLRPQSWISVKETAKNFHQTTGDFAKLEGLAAHGAAVVVRFAGL